MVCSLLALMGDARGQDPVEQPGLAVLDLGKIDSNLTTPFAPHGLFTDGTYGYVAQFDFGWSEVEVKVGRIARFLLSSFSEADVQIMELPSGAISYKTGFATETHGYLVPNKQGHREQAELFGKVVRFPLADFGNTGSIEILDLEAINQHYRGYNSGHAHNGYAYLFPRRSSGPYYDYGKILRFSLSTFGDVETLDIPESDSLYTMLLGGTIAGGSGWAIGSIRGCTFCILYKFSLESFGSYERFDMNSLAGVSGFASVEVMGEYGYLVTRSHAMVKFSLEDPGRTATALTLAGRHSVLPSGGTLAIREWCNWNDGEHLYIANIGFAKNYADYRNQIFQFDPTKSGPESLKVLDLGSVSEDISSGPVFGRWKPFIVGDYSYLITRSSVQGVFRENEAKVLRVHTPKRATPTTTTTEAIFVDACASGGVSAALWVLAMLV